MSAKTSKKSKRHSIELDNETTDFKPPPKKENDEKKIPDSNGDGEEMRGFTQSEINKSKAINEQNGNENSTNDVEVELKNKTELTNEPIKTRSRSTTPKNKKAPELHKPAESMQATQPATEESATVPSLPDTETNSVDDSVEIAEPIIDEPEPELQFEENSDLESGKSSPVMARCMTRRSLTRNIPTPKTPKLNIAEQNGEESDKNSVVTSATDEKEVTETLKSDKPDEINDSLVESNLSNKAAAGNESTRLNFTYTDGTVQGDYSPFLYKSKDRSVGETLRCLSSRRAIRAFNEDYHKYAIKNDLELKQQYLQRNSVESISGVKRKNRSCTPSESGEVKRFKGDSNSGLWSYIVSPISSIKGRFNKTQPPSSTPKLTAFKTKSSILENADVSKITSEVDPYNSSPRKWCNIM